MTIGLQHQQQQSSIRCLLVDHYDSYTHNLKDIFQGILGVDNVDEIKCDDKDHHHINLSDYSIIILSPGPGNPENRDDLGSLTSFILSSYTSSPQQEDDNTVGLPILFGVCLGHQAIAASFGGRIILSNPSRHGYLAMVIQQSSSRNDDNDHGSRGIFYDIPTHFSAIRYHSLEVDPQSLPESILPLAWTWDTTGVVIETEKIDHAIDNTSPSWLRNLRENSYTMRKDMPSSSERKVLMALRHTRLPIFGVQFHPESVCSEFGWQMCYNICQMAKARKSNIISRTSREALGLPIPNYQRSIPNNSSNFKFSWKSFPFGDNFDDLRFFKALFYDCGDIGSDTPPVVWLDSAAAKPSQSSTDGRYTFMAGGRQARRQQGSNLCVLDENLDVLWGHGSGLAPTEVGSSNKFDNLRQLCDDLKSRIYVGGEVMTSSSASLPPLIPPCIMGTLGYDSNKQSTIYLITDRVIAIDHVMNSVIGMEVSKDDDDAESSSLWFDNIAKAVEAVSHEHIHEHHAFCPTPRDPIAMRVKDSRQCYMSKIEACQQCIAFGDSYELCLTTQITGRISEVCPLCSYIRLREHNPTNYSAFMYLPKVGYIASGSPERFCKVMDGRVEMKPIKGTRPRGRDKMEDDKLIEELRTSPKDFAENLMIVDLVRNDLNTVCETGSVRCPKLMKIESYKNYHQLVSTVCGYLAIGEYASPVEALDALFPAGSMTGAPKQRSCDILNSIESGPRGIYSGAIGYISPLNGSTHFAVIIRTLVFSDDGRTVTTGCGGAIVAGSNPSEEWDEILVKARPQLWSITGKPILLNTDVGVNAILYPKISNCSNLRLFETMLLESDGTIYLFNEHAQRFASSAAGLWGVDINKAESVFRMEVSNRIATLLVSNYPKRIRIEISSSLTVESWKSEDCCCRPDDTMNHQLLQLSSIAVDHTDIRLYHKTTDRSIYPLEIDKLLFNERGEVTETSIANIGVRLDNGIILTPSKQCGLLPGCYRQMLLDTGQAIEGIITLTMLKEFINNGHDILCFNSVRGIWLTSGVKM